MVTGKFLILILEANPNDPENPCVVETQTLEKEFPEYENLDAIHTLGGVKGQIKYDVATQYFLENQTYPGEIEITLIDSFKPDKEKAVSKKRSKATAKLWADPEWKKRQGEKIREGLRNKKEREEAESKAKISDK